MTTLLAWVNILVIPIVIAVAIILGSAEGGVSVGKIITREPGMTLFPAIWFAAASGLFGYGLATLVGKSHERAA